MPVWIFVLDLLLNLKDTAFRAITLQSEAPNNREGYPLRPELVESLMYLFQATRDHNLLEMAADIVVSIQHSAKTECGYATVRRLDRQLDVLLQLNIQKLYLVSFGKLHSDKKKTIEINRTQH